MGATTYRLMSGFAAEMPDDPGIAAIDRDAQGGLLLHLEAPLSWANTALVDGDPVAAVQDMKRRDSRPLRTLGSLSLCRSLLASRRGGPLPRGHLPGHHRRHREDRIFDGYPDIALDLVDTPHVRRSAPVARVRSHGARRAAWCRQLTAPVRDLDGVRLRLDRVRAALREIDPAFLDTPALPCAPLGVRSAARSR